MKHVIVIFSALFLVSCGTLQTHQVQSINTIPRPSIEYRLVIDMNQDDLIHLGKIEEVVSIVSVTSFGNNSSFSSSTNKKQPEIERKTYITNLISNDVAVALMRAEYPYHFDQALSEIANRIVFKYPGVEYILFPKVWIEVTKSGSGFSSSIDTFKMHFSGSAVRLNDAFLE